jgi:hypothetical protein
MFLENENPFNISSSGWKVVLHKDLQARQVEVERHETNSGHNIEFDGL